MIKARRGRIAAGVIAITTIVALAGCSSGNPLDSTSKAPTNQTPGTIIVGSAAFPENEIIAEVYAQALDANGVTVQKKLSIGQRDAYLAAMDDGSINVIPEYSGNLLQFYDKTNTAQNSDDVYAALNDALPNGFEVLDQSKAQDKDSYNVTKDFSEKNNVTSLADLAGLDMPLKVGGNPELGQRPYGIPGLKKVYAVKDVTLVSIRDSGGPLTVRALKDGTVDLADIFSTTPAIKDNGFVTLDDPKNMIVAQNVVPLINKKFASDKVTSVLNTVSGALTTDDLVEFNAKSSGSAKESPSQIAKEWLAAKDLF